MPDQILLEISSGNPRQRRQLRARICNAIQETVSAWTGKDNRITQEGCAVVAQAFVPGFNMVASFLEGDADLAMETAFELLKKAFACDAAANDPYADVEFIVGDAMYSVARCVDEICAHHPQIRAEWAERLLTECRNAPCCNDDIYGPALFLEAARLMEPHQTEQFLQVANQYVRFCWSLRMSSGRQLLRACQSDSREITFPCRHDYMNEIFDFA